MAKQLSPFLVTHVLQHCGRQAKALGNVGVPFTRELIAFDPQTIIVLELSSYQIETLYQRMFRRRSSSQYYSGSS